MTSKLTPVILAGASMWNLFTSSGSPQALSGVDPGYLYEYRLFVTFIGSLLLLFAAKSSACTETVTVSLPMMLGVNGANVTIVCPPHAARADTTCESVNDSAPVMFKVTGTF